MSVKIQSKFVTIFFTFNKQSFISDGDMLAIISMKKNTTHRIKICIPIYPGV